MTWPVPPTPVGRSTAGLAADDRRVRLASIRVGLRVGFATAVILLIDAAITITVILRNRRLVTDTSLNRQSPFEPAAVVQPVWVLDPGHVVTTIVSLAVVSVAVLAVVAWYAARQAAAPLAEALQLQRHFVADASHELRTPLTVLSTRVQLLQHRLDRGEDVRGVARKLREDAAGMNDVLNDLLLTVEESGAATSTPVGPTVQAAVASLQPIADEAKVALRVATPGEAVVAVPARSLSRAVVALVDNAIQHSPSGGAVEVSATVEGFAVAIRVHDQGCGIASAETGRLFERFAHGESGRRRSFGLGLALVSEIAQRSRGDIVLESTGPSGTTFLLRLPVA
ncbi:MAG: HAMP domain-containing histidine kinase [Propionibacteriaceae bacterium]|nr:HAMP domain-containing histidine kinase [Propionibacteriaceae bacterium]